MADTPQLQQLALHPRRAQHKIRRAPPHPERSGLRVDPPHRDSRGDPGKPPEPHRPHQTLPQRRHEGVSNIPRDH